MIETVSTLEIRQRLGDLLKGWRFGRINLSLSAKENPWRRWFPSNDLNKCNKPRARTYSPSFPRDRTGSLRLRPINLVTKPSIVLASRAGSNV